MTFHDFPGDRQTLAFEFIETGVGGPVSDVVRFTPVNAQFAHGIVDGPWLAANALSIHWLPD